MKTQTLFKTIMAVIFSSTAILFTFNSCSNNSTGPTNNQSESDEVWSCLIDGNNGNSTWNMDRLSDSSIVISGQWSHVAGWPGGITTAICPFTSAPFIVQGTSISFSANGTAHLAADPSQQSQFTLNVTGNANNGSGSGEYTMSFAPPWPSGPGVWTGVRTSGSGITQNDTTPPPVPILQFPENGAQNVEINIEFQWIGSILATDYQLQVSLDPTFSTTVFNQSGITGMSQLVTGLSYNTTYYWRVRAHNSNGYSAYSNYWSFTTVVLIQNEMVNVPAGTFTMGSTVVGGSSIPEHQIYLDAYWIDKYLVTNYQYKLYCDANGGSSYTLRIPVLLACLTISLTIRITPW